jgi:hypothetical protein
MSYICLKIYCINGRLDSAEEKNNGHKYKEKNHLLNELFNNIELYNISTIRIPKGDKR